MTKISLIIACLCFLTACSNFNSKIETRKTEAPCFTIPKNIDPPDTSYGITDTTDINKLNELILENKKIWAVKNSNLTILLKNKIEIEKNLEEVFLINTSNGNAYSITVKTILDDDYKTSSTNIYKLNPGEELKLGCNFLLDKKLLLLKQTFQIVGEKKLK